MGVLLAWAVGYVVGAQAGAKGFDDVVRALKEVHDSEEAHGLWLVVRSHLAHALRSTAEMLEATPVSPVAASNQSSDVVDRVRLLMRRS